jgi:predicted dehydrogenase
MDLTKQSASAGRDSRRDFIRKAATAAAAVASTNLFKTPVYGQATAPSTGRVIGANDRIAVAFVGVGTQGLGAHVQMCKKFAQENNIALAAVCDVAKTRVEEAKKVIGGDCVGFDDYRKLLEKKDLDAVFCSTVDHWHARITIDALNAGKHVYCEKPMSRYLGEAFEVQDAVKKTGKILQVGSQGTSDLKWHKAAQWIREGKIGPVVMSQGSYMRNNPKGEWNKAIEPWCTATDVDWKMWHGDQIKTHKDFSADDYFRWRKYYAFCAGLLGDLMPHKLHPYMLATGNPEFPARVACVGTRMIETDKNTPGTPNRDCPEILQLIGEFPSGMVMHITTSSVNEFGTQEAIRGHKAVLLMAGNKVELKPERPFTEEIDGETSEAFPSESFEAHHKNFFDCVRANKQPNCGIDLALRVQTVVSLAEMSQRLNIMCCFDEKTRKITTDGGQEIPAITYGSLPQS